MKAWPIDPLVLRIALFENFNLEVPEKLPQVKKRQLLVTPDITDEYSQVYFVSYRNMPSIDDLMQEWPAMFEEMLKEVRQFSKLYFFYMNFPIIFDKYCSLHMRV